MPKDIKYGNMPKATVVGGSSGDRSVIGGNAKATNAPFQAGPDKKKGASSAPYHYQSRSTGNKQFPPK